MGEEFRSIALTEAEFQHAIGLLLTQRREAPASADNIASVVVDDGDMATARVALKTPLVDGRSEIALETGEIVEAFILFCRDRVIPLPRNGRKTVVRRKDRVILEIELDWF
ncbi:MAG: hypothetical protein MI920_28655 [Kiloniellales bacterium]|nr:hypothetical protein [Kiloniellales bacterium]